ncbi:MAG: MATE family efflux transporter [Dehalococcoidales bacterium]|jgi:putative MATE family efflux protein
MSEPSGPASRQPALHRDWTQGSVVKNLLQLAWPMIVMEATYMVSQLWDMKWVGRHEGENAIAALGIANLVTMLISTVDMGIITGARAMIARFIGEKDNQGARKVAAQAFIMAAVWSSLVTVFGAIFAGPIIRIFHVDPAVVADGMKYLRVFFLGWIALDIMIIGLYSMQASGDSFRPMVLEISIRTIHLTICPLLVLGVGFFPELGMAGAALANVIAQCVGAVAVLTLLFGGHTRIKLSLRDIRLAPNIIGRMIKIGLPSLLSMVQANFAMFVITWIILPFGTAVFAANSLVSNFQNFIITPNIGLGTAVGVLVGQNLGAKKPERAVKSTWVGGGILEAFLICCGIVILVWAEPIVKFLSNDPSLVTIGASFMRIATVGYLVMGLNSALGNCINGAGDTLPNMLINIAMIWVVQIPLTYILSHYTALDYYGIRWALVIANVTGLIAYFTYFRSGRWQRKKV